MFVDILFLSVLPIPLITECTNIIWYMYHMPSGNLKRVLVNITQVHLAGVVLMLIKSLD